MLNRRGFLGRLAGLAAAATFAPLAAALAAGGKKPAPIVLWRSLAVKHLMDPIHRDVMHVRGEVCFRGDPPDDDEGAARFARQCLSTPCPVGWAVEAVEVRVSCGRVVWHARVRKVQFVAAPFVTIVGAENARDARLTYHAAAALVGGGPA